VYVLTYFSILCLRLDKHTHHFNDNIMPSHTSIIQISLHMIICYTVSCLVDTVNYMDQTSFFICFKKLSMTDCTKCDNTLTC